MKIRSLRHSDLEPLHQLYLSLTARMPPHPSVGTEQFANELTTTRFQEDEHWDEDAHLTLVAERASTPVALIHVSFLTQDARYTSLKAGTGIIRSLYASPEESSALNALLQIAVEVAKQRDCQNLQAFSAYAPLFHNCGASGLSNALPWIGRALVQERFETQGFPALAMYCSLDRLPFARLPLPAGAELRYDWVTRIGERDKTEGGFHLFFWRRQSC